MFYKNSFLFGISVLLIYLLRPDFFTRTEESLLTPVRVLPPLLSAQRTAEWCQSNDGTRTVRALIDLRVQVDLNKLGQLMSVRGYDRLKRRQVTVTALQQLAVKTQSRFKPVIQQLIEHGKLKAYRSFSVVNRLLVEGTIEGICALSQYREVAAIVLETENETAVLAGQYPYRIPAQKKLWGIQRIRAETAWSYGLYGEGIVVGIIDSGASNQHEQLHGNFRGGDRSWHDPVRERAWPQDSAFGHGTGVLSVAVGGNVRGFSIGIAPKAKWVACAGLPEGYYNNVIMTECADWILTAAQPDILINAWQIPGAACDLSIKPIINAWRAAEIFPIFAAGNHGPGKQTDRSPANYVGLYPGERAAFSVGGMNQHDTFFSHSSEGPSSCGETLYPSVVAPAENIAAAFPLSSSTYIQGKGTSLAAGVAAGAAALLLQAYPEASVTQLEDALMAGSVDLGPQGPDNLFGHGRLDIPLALDFLARRLTIKVTPSKANETAIQK